MTINDTK